MTLRPYFDSTRAASPIDAPHLLLVCFHFPPSTAVGGLRWQNFSKYVVGRGWTLDVLTLDPSTLTSRDDGRLQSLPLGIRVFGVIPPRPSIAALPKLLWRGVRRWLPRRTPYASPPVARAEAAALVPAHTRLTRAYFSWLDFVEGRRLARVTARIASSLAHERPYAAVISSGPPHMAHEAARIFARRARIPFIADFRDPWSMLERVPADGSSPVWFSMAAKVERRVVDEAALISMNTERSQAAMQAEYPAAAARIITVRNGSDDDPLPVPTATKRFTIRFAGTVYIDRDPRLVFRAAACVIDELGLTSSEFGILLAGDVSEFGGPPIPQMAAEEGIAEFVEVLPRLPRAEIMQFLADGTMLLNLPQDSDLAVPAKIYEYVRFDAWLLILAKPESATADVLRDTDADVVDPGDVFGIADVIRRRYQEYARRIRPLAVGRDGRFDRRIQADRLLDGLGRVAGLLTAGMEIAPQKDAETIRIRAERVMGRFFDRR